MRVLDNPKLSTSHLAPGLRRVVLEASTGELIACEITDATAAGWAEQIGAPSPSDSPLSIGEASQEASSRTDQPATAG